MMLDGDQLEVFLAIAETRHFVRAADRLGIAQSVVSKRLQRLEDRLGARLVTRGSRKDVALTRAGQLFLDEARAALASLRQAERIGRNIARGAAGPLRIGYVFSAAMSGTLARVLRALRDALPDLDVRLSLMETPVQFDRIVSGEIDIGLTRPRPSYPPAITARTVHREPLVLALADDHPLTRHAAVRLADLAGEPFIMPQFHEEVGLAEAVRDLARAGGFAMPALHRTDDFISAAVLAAAGRGVVLAPASLQHLALDGLTFRPLADHAATVELALLCRDDTPAAARGVIERALAL